MSGPGLFEAAAYYEVPEEINVYSWSPSPDASTPATQVHLHLGKPPGPIFVIRFKSAKGLDRLLDVLSQHREDVWGAR